MRSAIVMAAVWALALAIDGTLACTCMPSEDDPVRAARGSTAVFYGELVRVEESDTVVRMTFRVLERVKGPRGKELTVSTRPHPGECGLPIREIGSRHLLYAGGDKSDLRLSWCSRTRYVERPFDDLKLLRRRSSQF